MCFFRWKLYDPGVKSKDAVCLLLKACHSESVKLHSGDLKNEKRQLFPVFKENKLSGLWYKNNGIKPLINIAHPLFSISAFKPSIQD